MAVITEPGACDSDDTCQRAVEALSQAVSNGKVDLISLRQQVPSDGQKREAVLRRLVKLAQQLLDLPAASSFRLVVSSDWVEVLDQVKVHGIHVKESHRERIPILRAKYPQLLIGTSAHSVESALDAYQRFVPDYFFVGTCYVTQTHPEKSARDLEGPALPGQVAAALRQQVGALEPASVPVPPVLAIGGIGPQNCHEPVRTYGADGVATIRAVLQSADPAKTVQQMRISMETGPT